MASKRLEGLALDIQFRLLCQIDCVQSLYNLIRASPVYFKTFSRHKELILSAVLKQIIVQDVLPDAVAAVHATSMNDFVERHKIYVWVHQPIPLHISMPLCRFSRTLQYFAVDYFREKTAILREFVGSVPQKNRRPSLRPSGRTKCLSIVEKGRIQRALCRVECFIRFCIHGFNSGQNDNDGYAAQLFRELALLLRPWEIEEMACIRDYIRSKLMKLFRQMETDFVREHIYNPQRPGTERDLTIDWKHNHVFFSYAAKDLHHELCVEFLLAYGLHNLRRLFTSEYELEKLNILALCTEQLAWRRRRVQVGSNTIESYLSFTWNRPFLAQALSYRPVFIYALVQQETDAINGNTLTFDGDKLNSRNEGWVWAKEHVRSATWSCEAAYNLRRWGYVFWDHSRLKASGLQKLTKRDVAERCVVSRDTLRDLSAQERLEGATKGVYQLAETWLYQYGEPRT